MVLIPATCGQVNFVFGGPSLPNGAEVVFGFLRNPGHESPSEDAIAMYSFFGDAFLPLLADTVGLRSCRVKWGPTATGPSYEHVFSTAGEADYDACSPQVCYLLRKETEFGGRAGRGRAYLPGVVEPVVAGDGVVSSGSVTDLSAACAQFMDDMTLNGTPIVLLHGPDSPLEDYSIITGMACDARVATQRRRLRR